MFSVNLWFLGPMPVCLPSGIPIDSAVFAGHTRVSNTQTDTQTDKQAYTQRPRCVEICAGNRNVPQLALLAIQANNS